MLFLYYYVQFTILHIYKNEEDKGIRFTGFTQYL